MPKEIICVYQDCVMCGDKGQKLQEIVVVHGIALRKVSFASPEGRRLSQIAVFDKGIKRMPFFTDGEDFAEELLALVCQKPEEKPKTTKQSVGKHTRKTRQSVKKGGAE